MTSTLIDVIGGPYCGERWATMENVYKVEVPVYEDEEEDTSKPIEWAVYRLDTAGDSWIFKGVVSRCQSRS